MATMMMKQKLKKHGVASLEELAHGLPRVRREADCLPDDARPLRVRQERASSTASNSAARRRFSSSPASPTSALFNRNACSACASKARGEVSSRRRGPRRTGTLTLRALEAHAARATSRLYDNLISPAVPDLLPPTVERIYVGKRRAEPRDAAGGDQRPARPPRESRQARAAIEGRRSLYFRPRRRGNRHAVGQRHPVRSGTGHHGGARRGRLRRHPAHPPRLRAIVRLRHRDPAGTAAWTSTGRAPRAGAQTIVVYMGFPASACAVRGARPDTALRRRRRRRSCSREPPPHSAS